MSKAELSRSSETPQSLARGWPAEAIIANPESYRHLMDVELTAEAQGWVADRLAALAEARTPTSLTRRMGAFLVDAFS
jgi:hypothetical protein